MVSDESTVEGAQRIGGLWRIYLTDQNTRVQALCTGINIRGIQINLKDKNPYLVAGHDEVESTRLYIRNVPLSYDNDAIENSIKSLGVQMLGSLKYVRARTPAGKLTNFKTGDRFVDIIVPSEPLPKKKSMGLFTASLYHKEQKQSATEIECGNCKQSGHVRRDCKNEPVCYDCLKPGHKKGSPLCTGFQSCSHDPEMETEDDDTESLEGECNEEVEDEGVRKEGGTEDTRDDETDSEKQDQDTDSNDEKEVANDESKNKKKQGGEATGNKENKTNEVAKADTEEQKQTQKLLSEIWKLGTPVAGRAGSPSRVRKAGERTPDENQEKNSKKAKKQKKLEKNANKNK